MTRPATQTLPETGSTVNCRTSKTHAHTTYLQTVVPLERGKREGVDGRDVHREESKGGVRGDVREVGAMWCGVDCGRGIGN